MLFIEILTTVYLLCFFFFIFFFFFSSRRRHTRSLRDWSSDVCSSDLDVGLREHFREAQRLPDSRKRGPQLLKSLSEAENHRSEERRVGKECRSRWSPYQ